MLTIKRKGVKIQNSVTKNTKNDKKIFIKKTLKKYKKCVDKI